MFCRTLAFRKILQTHTSLQTLLTTSSLPLSSVVGCFAYGSGYLSQDVSDFSPSAPSSSSDDKDKKDKKTPMLDLIIITSSPSSFHTSNLSSRPSDYALISRLLGASFVTSLQSPPPSIGLPSCGKSYFNPMCNLSPEQLCKYGVISQKDLLDDLENWRGLYVAGRLMKPVGWIIEGERVMEGVARNLRQAVSVGIINSRRISSSSSSSSDNGEETIILPKRQIYSSIASLSYSGDIRLAIGAEDPKKVTKLLGPPGSVMENLWDQTYQDVIKQVVEAGGFGEIVDGGVRVGRREEGGYGENGGERALWMGVPESVRTETMLRLRSSFSSSSFADSARIEDTLNEVLQNRVQTSSAMQTLKGGLTAGVGKSLMYAGEKFRKGGWFL